MNVTRTYHILMNKISQIIPTNHAYRQRNLAWLLTGILHSRSVYTTKIATYIVGTAQKGSGERRLSRFLANGKVHVRKWYEAIAKQLLRQASQTGCIRLIIDGSKISQNHQLLMVALAYRRRALPIVWTWIRSNRGHSSGCKQIALFKYIKALLPEGQFCIVVTGDSEFTPLQAIFEEWKWGYVLRQKGSHLLLQTPGKSWQRTDSLLTGQGQQLWLTDISLTREHKHQCNFLALWARGEKQPWLLATNLSSARLARIHYGKRMWIEEMFGDFKTNGADLEHSRLCHFLRLSRLTLAVVLLYLWLVAFGSATIKQGKRYLVDRRGRRDLSIFRIGYDMFLRCLINNGSISFPTVPYFT